MGWPKHALRAIVLTLLLAPGCGSSPEQRSADSESPDVADSAGAAPAGQPYRHVRAGDVGVTIGVGSIAPVPTTAYEGPTTLSEPTTIENVVIDGCLRVQADDVVLSNVIIRCDGLYPIQASGGSSGLVLQNSLIECGSQSKAVFITDHADATIRNNEITGCEDFFFIGGEVGELLVENNYMHALNLSAESHADGFQIGEAQLTTGTITIRGNLIDPDAEGGKTDILFATNFTEADIIVESNYLHVWGLKTLRCDAAGATCAVRYNVFDDAFREVETPGGKRLFLQSGTDIAPVFECNRYPDGSFVVEDDIVDRVEGTDHVIDGCPDFPGGDGGQGADATDVGSPDARRDDAGTALAAGLTELTLEDGSRVRGELVATYDQSLWWDPSDAETYALFDSAGFAPYPDDRSLQFVSSLDVTNRVTAGGPVAGMGFHEWLRAQQIVSLRSPLVGVAYVITGHESYHLEENGYGDFAWDFVRTDDAGQRFTGAGAANSDYLVWAEPVYLPTGGVVVEVVRDVPDNVPGSYPEDAPENLVGVALGGQYTLYLLHFRQGTVPSPDDASCAPDVPDVPCVVVGAELPAGAYLGEVGNSGTSLEPHLHMTVLFYDLNAGPPRSWSVASELAELWVSSSATGPAQHHTYAVPRSGEWVSGSAF